MTFSKICFASACSSGPMRAQTFAFRPRPFGSLMNWSICCFGSFRFRSRRLMMRSTLWEKPRLGSAWSASTAFRTDSRFIVPSYREGSPRERCYAACAARIAGFPLLYKCFPSPALFGVSFRAPHEDVVGEALRVEMPGLLSDGTAPQSRAHPALEHGVGRFGQRPPAIAAARPSSTELLASRPICAPHRDTLVTQGNLSLASGP